MSQMTPIIELPAAIPVTRRRKKLVPGWLLVMLGNPKARVGLGIVFGMVLLGLIAPLLEPASKATEFSLLDARQHPSMRHLFGTTDQGTDVFAQVIWGARRSLLLGAAAGAIATVLATTLGVFAAYLGGIADDILNLITNVFFVIPTIPLLIDVTAFLHTRSLTVMIFVIEIISELMKNLSLSLRLYGNIHGGHEAVTAMNQLGMHVFGSPWINIPIGSFLLPIKLLTVVVQAMIFTLLTCVYLSLVTGHDEGHEHGNEHERALEPAHVH